MPYTQEELQDVDFYREFIDKNRSDYLERIVKNASPENEELRPFRRSDGTIVSFVSFDNGLDLVDANLNDNVYSAFTSALNNGAGIRLYNFLNADFNAYMEGLLDTPGAGAESLGEAYSSGEIPDQATVSDVKQYIRELVTSKPYNRRYPEYTKDNKLENIIDRSISELSIDAFAETLPPNIVNGDVVVINDPEDSRIWLIENNQKRIFPDINSFIGTSYGYQQQKTLPLSQINSIPDGDPVEI